MSGKILLDTNCVIAIFASDQAEVDLASEADKCLLPAIVLGELSYGAHRSKLVQQNLTKIAELCRLMPVLG